MIKITPEIPLLGCIAFGIIDRGTNLLQVRATSACNLNCIFCSTDSGPHSQCHKTNFTVDLNYLIEETKKIVEFKNTDIEINIDSVGEPLTYPELTQLIKRLKNIPLIYKVSIQTNGLLLTKDKLKELKSAGLDSINLSISSLDPKLAKELSNQPSYDINSIIKIAKEIPKYMELRLCPVWIPKINDVEIPKIIEFAKDIDAKLGIQKYEIYKYSRKIKKVKPITWWKFYKSLKDLEKKHNIKLILTKQDMEIKKAKRIPEVFKKGEKIQATVKLPGWYSHQMIAIAKDRCIAINNCTKKIDDMVNIKILETKNNLYVGEQI
ncbi:MAG: radical SAM protein [archaeon]